MFMWFFSEVVSIYQPFKYNPPARSLTPLKRYLARVGGSFFERKNAAVLQHSSARHFSLFDCVLATAKSAKTLIKSTAFGCAATSVNAHD
jgi:hypothetical protein